MNGVFSYLFVLLPISVAALKENGALSTDIADLDSNYPLKITESVKQDTQVGQSRSERLRFHTFEGPQGGHFDKRPIMANKYRPKIIDTRTRGNLFRRSVIDVPFLKNRWKRSGHLKDNENFRRERQRLFDSFIGPRGDDFDRKPLITMRYGASIIDDRTATGTLSARRSQSNGSRLKKLQSKTTSPESPMTTAASRKSSGGARKTTSSGGAKKNTSSGGARRTTSKEPLLADINKRTRNGKGNRRTKRFVRNHTWRDIIRQSVMVNPSIQFETGKHGEADFLKWTLLNLPFQQSDTDHTTQDRLAVSIKIVGPIRQRLSRHRPMFLSSIIGPSKGLEQTKNIEGLQNELGPIIKHSILKSDVLKKLRTANSDLPFTKPKIERIKPGGDFTYQVVNSMIDPRTVDRILIQQMLNE